MNRYLISLLVVSSIGVGCVQREDGSDVTARGRNADEVFSFGQPWWEIQKNKRQAELDSYLQKHEENFKLFRDYATGQAGVPFIFLRVFPDLFPNQWKQDGRDYGLKGFPKNPYKPESPVPIGIGYTTNADVKGEPPPWKVAHVSCGSCHMGQVKKDNGEIETIVGGANTQLNTYEFVDLVKSTLLNPDFTYEKVSKAILAKDPGSFYAVGLDPRSEKAKSYKEMATKDIQWLTSSKDNFESAKASAIKTFSNLDGLRKFVYPEKKGEKGPKGNRAPLENFIGSFDAYGFMNTAVAKVIVSQTKPGSEQRSQIPPFIPARVDIPSVWMQSEKPLAQWDGSIQSAGVRNLAASLALVGSHDLLDVDLSFKSSQFLANLPPPPYPFDDITKDSVMRGEKLARLYCTGCHTPGSKEIMSVEDVGTDPFRAKIYNGLFQKVAGNILNASCTNEQLCQEVSQTNAVVQRDIKKLGYVVPPLSGIWATSPYLHNGSVPTIRHLLQPSTRPKLFFRGGIGFDKRNLGFDWHSPQRGVKVYDTSLEGQSNAGHSSIRFLGQNWEDPRNAKELEDLLTYLKTL